MSNLVKLIPEEYKDEYKSFSKQIKETIEGESRWSVHYNYIYKYNDKYYEFSWAKGATECQEDDEPSNAIEVMPVKTMVEVTKYVPIVKK